MAPGSMTTGTNNNIMPSGNVIENFYMKQSVIYLLRIWIIEGIPQISASCVRMVCLEVMGLSGQVLTEWLKTGMQHELKSCCTTENIDSKSWLCWIRDILG